MSIFGKLIISQTPKQGQKDPLIAQKWLKGAMRGYEGVFFTLLWGLTNNLLSKNAHWSILSIFGKRIICQTPKWGQKDPI